MKPFMEQNGALMIRPMLEQPKSVVYDFASKFYIPYTKDTTPNWSCRGVMRR
jgi:tRNA(Ile)-lysidine synthase TilS/MesJ